MVVNRVSGGAIAAGIAVDLLATNILLLPVMAGVAGTAEIQGLPTEAQGAAIMKAMEASSAVYALGIGLGSAASIAGGWVAARVAGRAERLHGTLSALGCVGLGIYGWVAGIGDVPAWTHLLFLALSPTLGFVGGAWRVRQVARGNGGGPVTGARRLLYWCDWLLAGLAGAAVIMFSTLGVVSGGGEG